MGKIKKRVKYNHRNIKPDGAGKKNDDMQDPEDQTSLMEMDFEDQPLSDGRSTVYSASSRMSINNITKKEKRQIKRDNWARRKYYHQHTIINIICATSAL